MKKNKEHKKGQESTIGKIIYGFLLFMPLLAIGITCGYAMFNKNAYQSWGDTYNRNETQITSSQQLEDTFTYIVNYYDNTNADSQDITIYYYDININWTDYGFTNISYDSFAILNNNTIRVYEKDNHSNYFTSTNAIWGNTLNSITFQFKSYTNPDRFGRANTKYFAVSYQTGKISDVFYYAVDKVTESQLFNWAQNSIIYTTMSTTCTQLSITTPFIPLLLSYWLIISVIYFLYDIALMLIWLLHDKIHEMRDSLA